MRFAAAAALALVFAACGGSEPTFTEDVAPIVHARCASCHREGGAAPFALVTYEDVKGRATQIADVTRTRYMPPWLPERGRGDFEGARVLSSEEIETLAAWASAGAPEGDPEALDAFQSSVQKWELGAPDVVAEMAEPFELPAEGRDVFRNFVLPVPTDRSRYVEAIELRPNDRRLVHHATITLDPTRSSRRLDAEDPVPGFDGMSAAPGAVMPDGHFLGWTPGKSPRREPEGMSWLLPRGADLVVQLHMPTTGKTERVSASVGLHFTDQPPRVVPVTLRLGSRRFEIPAGEKEFTIEDAYVLPVEVRAISIYPHAHYLAREMRARAFLPDGTERWLVSIPEWDFNWQEFYRYREPVLLPRGTRVEMEYVYDNSAENPRNPSRPPRAVAYGPQSTDEMGDLYLQVIPVDPAGLEVLRADYGRKELEERVLELTFRLERDPGDANALNSLGVAHDGLGRDGEALEAFEEALRVDPELEDARFNLATLLSRRGESARALEQFRRVLASDPDCVDCRVRAGNLLRDLGRVDEALGELERAVELDPNHAWAHYSSGLALQIRGDVEGAIEHYEEVARLEPGNAEVRLSLGSALTAVGRCTPALLALEEALRLAPEWPEALSRLAYALTECPQSAPGASERAVALASRAAERTRFEDPYVLDTLGIALAASGRQEDARGAWEAALERAHRSGNGALVEELRGKLSRLER